MTYAQYESNAVIFQQGEIGSSFYVILRGEVTVTVTHMGHTFIACELKPGAGFGELALAHSEPRSATVTTSAPTELLVIAGNDYNAILRQLHAQDINEKLEFFSGISLFSSWGSKELLEFASICITKRYPRNKVIVKEGDPRENVYFIKGGQCRVLKKVRFPRKEVLPEHFIDNKVTGINFHSPSHNVFRIFFSSKPKG